MLVQTMWLYNRQFKSYQCRTLCKFFLDHPVEYMNSLHWCLTCRSELPKNPKQWPSQFARSWRRDEKRLMEHIIDWMLPRTVRLFPQQSPMIDCMINTLVSVFHDLTCYLILLQYLLSMQCIRSSCSKTTYLTAACSFGQPKAYIGLE